MSACRPALRAHSDIGPEGEEGAVVLEREWLLLRAAWAAVQAVQAGSMRRIEERRVVANYMTLSVICVSTCAIPCVVVNELLIR